MSAAIDEMDKKILNLIQSRFPVDQYPYKVLADQTGLSEEEAWERVERLRSNGFIRRIGAVFDSSGLGFHSTLVGAKVDPVLIDELAKKINELPGITHHYQRSDEFNLWFTLTARDPGSITKTIEEVKGWEGVMDILNLPALRTFKIKVDFRV